MLLLPHGGGVRDVAHGIAVGRDVGVPQKLAAGEELGPAERRGRRSARDG